MQQHQVELCLLLAIDEQEPASAEYLASLARLRDSGVRIALHPQRIDTDARQCFAEVDAGLCDYLGLDARLLALGPLTRNLRQRKSIEYLNRLLVAQDIQMLCLNVDNEELHQQANALPSPSVTAGTIRAFPGLAVQQSGLLNADAAASRHARLARYPARRYPWQFRRTGTTVMGNYFESPFRGKLLSEQVSNPNIRVGRYSYYSGYYHGHSFDDCARYLMPDRDDVDKLVIGSFCSIGSGAAFIMAGNQGHRAEWASTFPFHFMHEEPAFAGAVNGYQPAGDTLIGHDVWIGTEAMFMPGVRVGHGAIIGSRALVTGDVEPYAIVGGNPARTIRKRFSDGDIQNLLEMAWWDWPLADIEAAMPLLCAGDIPALYRHWKQRQATA